MSACLWLPNKICFCLKVNCVVKRVNLWYHIYDIGRCFSKQIYMVCKMTFPENDRPFCRGKIKWSKWVASPLFCLTKYKELYL